MSCAGTKTATGVLVRISAQGAALDADAVRVRVLGGKDKTGLSEQRVIDVKVKSGWPVEVALEPKNGDARRAWRVEAWALGSSTELGAGSAEGGFTAGTVVEKDVTLRPGADLGVLPDVTVIDDAGAATSGGAVAPTPKVAHPGSAGKGGSSIASEAGTAMLDGGGRDAGSGGGGPGGLRDASLNSGPLGSAGSSSASTGGGGNNRSGGMGGSTGSLTADQQTCLSKFSADDCDKCSCMNCTSQYLACRAASTTTASDQCNAVLTCSRQNNCTGTPCFCGTDTAQCGYGTTAGPAGPCARQIEAAAQAAWGDVFTVNARAMDLNSPLGRAYAADACRVAKCASVCR